MLSVKKIFLKNSAVILFFIGVFIFLYFLNAIFPTQSDDMGRGIGGLSAAIDSYNRWNGRFGELLLVAFGSYLSTTPFYAPINAFFGASVVLLLFINVFARKPELSFKDSSIFLTLISFLLIDTVFCFGSVFYWAAGSFNYLLAWFFIFLWVLPYRFYWKQIIDKKKYKDDNRILKTFFLITIGFIAGWSTEFGIVFVFLQLVVMIYVYIKCKRTLPFWYFIGIISLFAGWLFLYTCPGVSARIQVFLLYDMEYLSIKEIIKMPLLLLTKTIINTYSMVVSHLYYENYLLVSLFMVATSFLYKPCLKKIAITLALVLSMGISFFVFPKMLSLLFFILVILLYACQLRKNDRNLFVSFFIIICVLLTEFIFIGATIQVSIPRRASFQYTILNFILIAILMNFCFDVFKNNFKIRLSAFIFCLFLNLSVVSFVSLECYNMYSKWDKMLVSIEKQKVMGNTDVVVDRETFVSKYWNYGDWSNPTEDSSYWVNARYAEMYGVDTFTAK